MKFAKVIITPVFVILIIAAVSFGASQPVELPKSLSLEQAVELGLQRNQDVVSALKEVDRAKAVVMEARSTALPQLNFTATANHVDNYYAFLSGSGLTGDLYGLTYTLSQIVSSFGRVSNALLGAKIYVQLSETKLELTRKTVTYQVTKSFYDVLLTQELVRVQQEAVNLAESHLRMATLRYEQGVGSEFEMLRAQVRVANLQPALINAKNNFIIAKQNLNAILNIQPEQPIEIIGELNYSEYIPDSDTAWQIAQVHRPDLRILNQTKQVNEVQLNYYRAGYRPNLYLIGEWDRQKAKFSDSSSEQSGDWVPSWTAGLSLQWSIFDGFKTAAQIRQAKSTLGQAEAALTKGLLSAQVEVKQTCLGIKQSSAVVISSEKAVKLAERALSMAKTSFENGRASTLDVSDAQLELTTAQTNYAQAVHDYQVALAKLKLDTGSDTLP